MIRQPPTHHVVMNCIDYDPKKFKGGALSWKKDGVRAYYYPGQPILWSRDRKPILGMNHIIADLEQQNYPYIADMELWQPGKEFNEISGIVRDHSPSPDMQGHIIDVVTRGFISDRLKCRPKPTENIFNIDNFRVTTRAQRDRLHLRFLEEGHEGSVLKSFHHLYENKRNWHWMRDVPVKSEDCKCTGVYEGNGKMQGMAGGIFIDFMGIPGKCGTMKGLDYDARRELLENAEDYIGVYAEIQYKNLQPSGLPRQPRFKGWRYDKGD